MPIIKVPQPVPAPDHRITVLAFRNRFTHEEKVAIEVAAETSPDVRVYLADLAASKYIDLTDERLVENLDHLVQAELITEERKTEILTSPIQDIERYS